MDNFSALCDYKPVSRLSLLSVLDTVITIFDRELLNNEVDPQFAENVRY